MEKKNAYGRVGKEYLEKKWWAEIRLGTEVHTVLNRKKMKDAINDCNKIATVLGWSVTGWVKE